LKAVYLHSNFNEKYYIQYLELLYNTYIKEGGWKFKPNNQSGLRIERKKGKHILTDDYMSSSVIVVLVDEYDNVCAGIRAVLKAPKIEIENYMILPSHLRNSVVEVNRMAVKKNMRRKGLTEILYLHCVNFCRKNKIQYILCSTPFAYVAKQFKMYERFNLGKVLTEKHNFDCDDDQGSCTVAVTFPQSLLGRLLFNYPSIRISYMMKRLIRWATKPRTNAIPVTVEVSAQADEHVTSAKQVKKVS
jgi:hypothetical protein